MLSPLTQKSQGGLIMSKRLVEGAISDTHVEAENVNVREVNIKQTEKLFLATMVVGFFCLGLMFGTTASAADKNPCSADIARLCSDFNPGTQALMDCLEKNENELSDACKNYEAGMGGKKAERREQVRQSMQFRQACMNDMVKFCNDANPEQGGMLTCLNDHEKELSAPCNESIKVLKEER
jgi:hypothetical protein